MAITITIAGTDRSSDIDWPSLQVVQALGTSRNTAELIYKKYGGRSWTPNVMDTVQVSDGGTVIFGGRAVQVTADKINEAMGVQYKIDCVDYAFDLDGILVSEVYASMSVNDIIADILSNYAPSFTGNNVNCGYVVSTVTFNQMTITQCLKRLADLVLYQWYVDPSKDVHFFSDFGALSPFNITDTNGYANIGTLETIQDGSQIINSVKVRGATENGAFYSDTITVKGSVSKSWSLPYSFVFSTFDVSINGSSKTVGAYGVTDFSSVQVLYNATDQSIQVQNALNDGDTILFSGTPQIPILAVAQDATSIALYGQREKLIKDTSIVDINVARQRAITELDAFKDPLTTGSFYTYTSGLNIGQTININSTIENVNANLLIWRVTFTMRSPTAMLYYAELTT